MADRNANVQMLTDTLSVFEKGYYEKNGKRINLKLSKEEREEVDVGCWMLDDQHSIDILLRGWFSPFNSFEQVWILDLLLFRA